jgi:hypothetical protein
MVSPASCPGLRVQTYRIDCIADPGTLSRIAGFFARYSSIPDRVHMSRDRSASLVEVVVSDLTDDEALLVAARLRVCPLVTDVALMPADAGHGNN